MKNTYHFSGKEAPAFYCLAGPFVKLLRRNAGRDASHNPANSPSHR